MANYLQDALDRITAMQIEAITDNVDAVDYWPYEQEAFPYFTNRLGAMTLNDTQYSEAIPEYTHTVLMRLVVGHVKSGYRGEKPDKVVEYVGEVQSYFRNRPMLTTDAGSYISEPDYLFYEARLTGHTGIVVFNNSGLISNQIGVEFTLELPFLREVDLA